MLQRRKAIEIIKQQLDGDYKAQPRKHFIHYGRTELKVLMDAIYGCPPKCKQEEVPKLFAD